MSRSSKENARRLEEIAAAQEYFFTATQAKEAGYVDAVHGYHVQNGDWVKHYRGIYRLAGKPAVEWPDLVIWSLWSRDRSGAPLGVYSHETAAMIHGALPRTEGPLHMTVPRSFRKNCEIPEALVLHKEDLDPDLIEQRPGYAVLSASPRTCSAALRPYDDVIRAGED
jgi:hypothetical protein